MVLGEGRHGTELRARQVNGLNPRVGGEDPRHEARNRRGTEERGSTSGEPQREGYLPYGGLAPQGQAGEGGVLRYWLETPLP